MQKRGAFLWDDQHMPKAQRSGVKEGEHVFVFIHAVAWDLTIEDASEDGWFSAHAGKILWKAGGCVPIYFVDECGDLASDPCDCGRP